MSREAALVVGKRMQRIQGQGLLCHAVCSFKSLKEISFCSPFSMPLDTSVFLSEVVTKLFIGFPTNQKNKMAAWFSFLSFQSNFQKATSKAVHPIHHH